MLTNGCQRKRVKFLPSSFAQSDRAMVLPSWLYVASRRLLGCLHCPGGVVAARATDHPMRRRL